jgi:voltage-gated potassium channel
VNCSGRTTVNRHSLRNDPQERAVSGGIVMAMAEKLTRHVWLLAVLVGMEIANPLLAGEGLTARILSFVLLIVVVVTIFRAVLHTKHQRYVGAALVSAAIALEVARDGLPVNLQLPLDVILSSLVAAFFVFVFSLIVTRVFRTHRLGLDDVVGAFAGYIIIALIWGRLYALVWLLVPRSFSISPDIMWQVRNWHTLHTLFDYYSLATLATVGYGDITTTAPASNALVWLEVMCAQFYLAVVVATIVGIKVAQALASSRDGTEP